MPSKQTKMHSKLNRSGNIVFDVVLFIFGCGVLFGVIRVYESVVANQPSAIAEIKSGITGYCLDDHRDSPVSGAVVDTWKCNGTAAQTWVAKNNLINTAQITALAFKTMVQTRETKLYWIPVMVMTARYGLALLTVTKIQQVPYVWRCPVAKQGHS